MSDALSWTTASKEFGTVDAKDDLYRTHADSDLDSQVTETYYWTFFNAEANLHGYVYFMMRPNLRVGTCGVFAHIGSKRDYLAAEYFDFRTYMSDAFVDAQGNILTSTGLRIDFIDPMKKMRIRYVDKSRAFELDMLQDAVHPPMVRANGKHFEQTMRVTGSVVLDGVSYSLNHFAIRDRSWGERRPESGRIGPPYTWMTGVHSENLAFTIGAFDDPERNPNWRHLYSVDRSELVRDAWIWDRGQQLRFARISKITERDADGITPARNIIDCETSAGSRYRFVGQITANLPWKTWQNAMCHVGLTRWTSPQFDGEFLGITAEVQWNHYISKVCVPVTS